MTGVAARVCQRCDKARPTDQFKYRKCMECVRADARERQRQIRERDPEAYREYLRTYRRENPEKAALWVQTKQLAYMGLTIEQFDEMLARQGGCCAICRRDAPGGKGRWHVDHDHRCCGRKRACPKCVRGLLCFNCNVALGYLGDDAGVVLAAADYLMRFTEDGS